MSPLRLLAVLFLITSSGPARSQLLPPPPLAGPPAPAPVAPVRPPAGVPAGPEPRDAPPPLAPPGSVIPALATPDPHVEQAIRLRLFHGPLAATPAKAGDPETTEWEQARATGSRPACGDVGPLRYLFNRVDLDGDAQLETVVVVLGSYACASGGCTLLIFRSTESGLSLVAENGLFQSPLQVISVRHRGWLDLTMPASIDGAPGGVMNLQFNGRTYRPAAASPRGAPPPPSGTVVLELLPIPFERLGHPLPCGS